MKLFIIFLLFTPAGSAFSQSAYFDWVKQMGGISYDGGKDVVLDALGNIYITGYFNQTVDFDPGPAVNNLTAPANNEEDIFIVKLNASGNFLWARQLSGTFLDVAHSIHVDAAGNVYSTGIFFGTCDFNPGPEVFSIRSAGNEDGFISKLDASGNFLWAKTFGASSFDRSNDLSFDNAGNIYTVGFFKGTVDFNPGAAVFNLTAVGNEDMFMLKLGSSGNFIWARQIGGTAFEGGYSIAISTSGNIYCTGIFEGTADFDPGVGVFNLSASGLSDVFICKFDTEGNFKFAKRMGGNSYNRSLELAIDAGENIYTTGFFDNTVDFDPGIINYNITANGADDIFISKLDSSGNFIWAKSFGGNSYDAGIAITVDADNNPYITGYFQDEVDFDGGPGSFPLVSSGFSDIFIMRLTPLGNFVWAKKIGGVKSERTNAIKVDAQKNVFTIGNFEGTTDFDPGTLTQFFTSSGETDIFIHKMKQCETTSFAAINIVTCKSYILNNQAYHSSGTYTQQLQSASGCDSILTVNLTINRIITIIDTTVCESPGYYNGRNYLKSTGTYSDTLVNSLGCDSVVQIKLLVNPSPQPNLGADKDLCTGETIQLTPGNFINYQWNNSSTAAFIDVNLPGIYSVRVSNIFQCAVTDSFIINKINTIPAGFLPASEALCKGAALELNITGYSLYNWSSGENTAKITIRTGGEYKLTVTDANNCTGTDSITIIEKTGCIPIGIPNAFTPDKDGVNDIFKPVVNAELQDYRMQIFNRWGQSIFISTAVSSGWDGTFKNSIPVAGVYVYLIKYKTKNGEWIQHKGTVTLLR